MSIVLLSLHAIIWALLVRKIYFERFTEKLFNLFGQFGWDRAAPSSWAQSSGPASLSRPAAYSRRSFNPILPGGGGAFDQQDIC